MFIILKLPSLLCLVCLLVALFARLAHQKRKWIQVRCDLPNERGTAHFILFLPHCSVFCCSFFLFSLHRWKLRRHPSSLLIGVLPDMVRCNYCCLILSGNAVHQMALPSALLLHACLALLHLTHGTLTQGSWSACLERWHGLVWWWWLWNYDPRTGRLVDLLWGLFHVTWVRVSPLSSRPGNDCPASKRLSWWAL